MLKQRFTWNINYLREARRLETRVKGVIILFFSFCIGGSSEKRENRNKIEPNSPRDLILGSFPLPHPSLSVLAEIRVLPKIGKNWPKYGPNFFQEGVHFPFRSATRYKNRRD